MRTTRKLFQLIGPGQRARWSLVLAVAVIVSLAEAAATALVFTFLGALRPESNELQFPMIGSIREWLPWEGTELMAVLGLATAVVFATRSLLVLLQYYVQYRVAENAGGRLSTRLLDGYLAMPYVFHLQRNSSELIRNSFDSVQRFVQEGLVPGVQVVGRSAMAVGVIAVLLLTSPIAALFAIGTLGPLTWVVLRVVQPRVKRLGRTAQQMTQQNIQSLQQSLHGVRDISVLGRKRTFVDSYRSDRRKLSRARYLRQTAGKVPWVAIETGLAIFIVIFVWVAAAAEGGMDGALPLLGLFGYAAARLLPELQAITKHLNSLKFVGPAVDDLVAELALFRSVAASTDSEPVEPLPFNELLCAEDVSYQYPEARSWALRRVNMQVRPGQSVGLIGPTGGGKSTLVDIFLGLLEPTEGHVTVDGLDLHYRADAWRENLGVVPQMVFLIDDSLRANIALGVPAGEIDESALWEAVSMAQLEGFVASLPDGLDTVIGERGVRVSGGQRQRLAIARALYRRPTVLVFDEGTSALDAETEETLMGALDQLRGERTIITVAHRLTTVADCDTVFLLREGEIVDQGPLAELCARNPELQRDKVSGR